MREETGGEGKARYSQDNAVVVGVVSASVAVVVIMTLAYCCICRILGRQRSDDEEEDARQRLLNSTEESSSSGRQCSLLKSSAVSDILTLCIREIESRGLEEEGLYRKAGRKSEADRLRKQFKTYPPPDLSKVENIHVICSCLKGYLLNLNECVLTRALRSDFINAAGIDDRELSMTEIRRNIGRMSCNYREILIHLIIHLQRVSMSVACRMNNVQLAIIFGPSVVGWSDEPDPAKDPEDQRRVMTKLLGIPVEDWRSIELDYTPQSQRVV